MSRGARERPKASSPAEVAIEEGEKVSLGERELARKTHEVVSSESIWTGNLKVAFCMPDLKGASAVALQMDVRDDLVTLSRRIDSVK